MTAKVATLTLQETRLHFGGVVHFDNAEKVCNDGLKLLQQAPKTVTIDMQALESSSSIVLAILLSWLRKANQAQQTLHLAHMPDKLRAIIGVSGLTDTLSTLIQADAP